MWTIVDILRGILRILLAYAARDKVLPQWELDSIKKWGDII